MMFAKISILLLVISTVASKGADFFYRLESLDNSVSETCVTKNNELGNCQEYLKCKSAQQLYYSGRAAEISLCKVAGKIPFVCCPSKKAILVPKSKPNFTTKPAKKTSSKFQKALCKNVKHFEKLDNHITNGDKADVAEFPFQVALGYNSESGKEWDFNCGGSLIADDVVLTAAHCVNRKNIQPVIVRLGRTSLDLDDDYDDTEAQDIEIDTIIIHPKYSRLTRHNDIALIKLSQPVAPSNSVGLICLSTSDGVPEKEFTVTGFGLTSTAIKKTSDWLLKGKVAENPFEDCKEKFEKLGKKIVETQFCAISGKGVDTCQGDSGGPLFYEHNNERYLHAIASYGNSCGGTYPSIYTKVNKFLDWIEGEMADFENKFRSF